MARAYGNHKIACLFSISFTSWMCFHYGFCLTTMKSTTLAGDALVSVATIPLLMGLLAMKAGAEMMQKVGQTSEDIFQGDRLPVLKGPSMSDNLDSP